MSGPLDFLAGGDVMFGDSSHFLGRGVGSRIRRHGPSHPWREVERLIAAADLFVANLESPLSRTPGRDSWTRVYRGEPSAPPGLALAGETVLTLANNHILEHGPDLLAETHEILGEAGIGRAGFSADDPARLVSWQGEPGGRPVTVVAASLVRDLYGSPVEPALVEAAIGRELAAAGPGLRIVSIHWGDEYVAVPSPDQVALGRRLIDGGVDIVLGHHPHVLQPVERYGRGLIVYSLGNLLFDQDWGPDTRGGGFLKIAWGDEGLEGWEFLPTVCGADGVVRPARGAERDRLLGVVENPARPDGGPYRRELKARSREYRLRMKMELLRHFWRVTPDTLHFLATKRRRPARAQETGGRA